MSPHLRLSFAGLLLVLALGACDRSSPETEPSDVIDEVEEPSTEGGQRIVSLAPSVTETLFALGAGERVVGVTRFCDHPPEATSLPRVGGLTDVDVETVLSLRPDLVVGVRSETSRGLRQSLEKSDVESLFLPVETFADVQASIRTLGERVGAGDRAAEIAAEIGEHDVDPAGDAPRVVVLFGREPWVAAGPGTFAHEMVDRAGGRNALADLDARYPTLDTERFAALEADLVIDTSWGDEKAEIPLADVPVVRIDPALMRPGPRLVDAMDFFVRVISGAKSQ